MIYKKLVILFLIFLSSIKLNAVEYGICITQKDINKKSISKIKNIGFKYIRVDVYWQRIEKQKGEYNFNVLDKIVKLCDKNNIKILFIVDYANPLYLSVKDKIFNSYITQTRVMNKNYNDFLKTLVERYKNKVFDWEIWNEENSEKFWVNGVNKYIVLLKNSYEIIKNIQGKQSNVLLGGLSEIGNRIFLNELYGKGAFKYFDTIAFHTYYYNLGKVKLKNFKSDMLYYSKMCHKTHKKCWITEMGVDTSLANLKNIKNVEEFQLQEIKRKINIIKKMNFVDTIFIYEYKDTCKNLYNGECNFGIISYKNKDKLIVQYLKRLTHDNN